MTSDYNQSEYKTTDYSLISKLPGLFEITEVESNVIFF